MSFTIKDFIKIGLEEDITLKRREIRCIKKEIRYIEDMKKEAEATTESDFKKMLDNEPDMLAKYEEMKELIDDSNKKEIQRMQKEGKLREVLLDKNGKVIEEIKEIEETKDLEKRLENLEELVSHEEVFKDLKELKESIDE